jgi:hypothetical protein
MPKKTAITDYNAPSSEPFRLHKYQHIHGSLISGKANHNQFTIHWLSTDRKRDWTNSKPNRKASAFRLVYERNQKKAVHERKEVGRLAASVTITFTVTFRQKTCPLYQDT